MFSSLVLNQSGKLGADPEARYTRNGSMVVNLSVASNHYRGPNDYPTTWVRWAVFGKLAEFINERDIRKGDFVSVSGHGGIVEYKTRDGYLGTSIEATATSISLGGIPQRDGTAPQRRSYDETMAERDAAAQERSTNGNGTEQDIPDREPQLGDLDENGRMVVVPPNS
jgi:single-strand DNA-binding protein